jgi:hypothetical protein
MSSHLGFCHGYTQFSSYLCFFISTLTLSTMKSSIIFLDNFLFALFCYIYKYCLVVRFVYWKESAPLDVEFHLV